MKNELNLYLYCWNIDEPNRNIQTKNSEESNPEIANSTRSERPALLDHDKLSLLLAALNKRRQREDRPFVLSPALEEVVYHLQHHKIWI